MAVCRVGIYNALIYFNNFLVKCQELISEKQIEGAGKTKT